MTTQKSIGVAMFAIAYLCAHTCVSGDALIFRDEVRLICDRGNRNLSTLPPLNRTKFVSVTISYCPPPTVSYAVELQKLNVDIATLKVLSINDFHSETPLSEDHFAGLNLRHLTIAFAPSNLRQPNVTFHYDFSESLNSTGKVILSEGTRVLVSCMFNTFEHDGFRRFLDPVRSVRFKEMEVRYCPPPSDSYTAVLKALNIDATKVQKLNLHDIWNVSSLQSTHLTGLSLRELVIKSFKTIDSYPDVLKALRIEKLDSDNTSNVSSPSTTLLAGLSFRELAVKRFETNPVWINNDLLKPLTSLKELRVRLIRLPSFSNSSELINVTLREGSSIGPFGGCAELRELSVWQWQIPELKVGWLEHCPKLNKLEVGLLSEEMLQRALAGVRNITSLVIHQCTIDHISDKLLEEAVELRNLRIDEHRLYSIHWDAFKSQPQLEDIYLGNNGLSDVENLVQALQSVQTLRNLSLEYNHQLDFCRMFNSEMTSYYLPPLERLNLRGTRLSRLCFSTMLKLSYLDLSATNVTTLEFKELPSPVGHSLEVVLNGNTIDTLPSSEEDYHMTVNKFNQVQNVTVEIELDLDCDCQQGWLARALRDLPRLSVPGVRCSDGGERLDRVPPERLDCDKHHCERCVCRRTWQDNAIEVDCRGANLCTVPAAISRMPNVRKFIAPRNVIKPLRVEDLPKSLMVVDLRFNHISYVEEDAAAELFATPGRNVSLSGNPLVCDCENQPLIAALQAHRDQVTDFEEVTCVGEGRADAQTLGDVVASSLCAAARQRLLLALATAGGALLAAAALAGGLYRCYGRELRIFLYTRGWCLCCVREDPLEAQRPYDAFISFAHEDDAFVATELLPALESQFRLCVHTRNWVPGEMIATQIVRSVEQSRRTIIVLSRSFARSVWGMMEFRTAHVSALREGRVRVVLVVLDDVLQQPGLDAELRRYLRTNTYLRWGDPSFWERLWYALPHRRHPLAVPVAGGREPVAQPVFSQDTLMLSYPLEDDNN